MFINRVLKNSVIVLINALMVFLACGKIDERELNSDCELSALKAYVYYKEGDLSVYEEVDLLSGMYLPEKGAASFTFPNDEEKFNANSLKKCRLEATIPSTARVVLSDENGNETNCGIEGWHNLYNSSIYFNVVADSGEVKKYKVNCRCIY